MKTIRAKFRCMNINHAVSHSDTEVAATVILQPVWCGENGANADWSKYTPSGKCEMLITNPAAIEAFELGEEYFLTFAKAE